eukprot:TRINITY_DN1382_c0_g1_i1.p1 TRINITY_DN1382_c0_g1~~TRINITY_DN1382_c0_g1_i1.p1  ORF type:complete len:388 (-),score=35.65 TRINITY_DN1382_c0_g1_i1:47-1210(-)
MFITAFIGLVLILCVNSQTWPKYLYGDWEGTPRATPLGPLVSDQVIPWKIRPLSNGGFIMWDNMTSNIITGSSQQFWQLSNTLFYCGWLYNFFSSEVAPIKVFFQLVQTTPTSIRWCDSPSCNGFSWDITVMEDTLELLVLLSPPVQHLSVTFKRVSYDSTVIPYNSSVPDCIPPSSHSLSVNSAKQLVKKCPYSEFISKQKPEIIPYHLKDYEHCYQLNDFVEYKLYWTLTLPNKLSVAISTPSSLESATWIGIGFGSAFPGMNTSDIALGYITPTGTQCSRSMTALEYVGAPVDSSNVVLSNAVVSYTDGILTYEFERNLDSGLNPIPSDPPQQPGYSIIWAVGTGPLSDCTVTPTYHMNTRGYRTINVQYPEKVFDSYRLCKKI